ncbi:MAG: outer membrane protein transport protein [Myxococcales bacterium]|nr:outer membrane protein transport protein [Myxococcales bacterium]MDH3482687.1 outer membrane protein transport protein [Myxococcales bacterium]
MRGLWLAGLIALVALGTVSTARAGGYDIPILYSARHIGAGGTAVAGVHDSSAVFHNPAGMGHIGKANLLIDVTILTGDLRATPYILGPQSIQSEPVVAPFGLLGASLRVHEYITIGGAAYPVAAASGEYRYQLPDPSGTSVDVVDSTTLLFLEASPAIAVNFDKIGLRIGLGYRLTFVTLDRSRNSPPALGAIPSNIDLNLSGFSFLGFRVGFQWSITEYLAIGFNYRTKTTTKVDESGNPNRTSGSPAGLGQLFTDASTEFVLPARLTTGIRFDWEQFTFKTDFEWGFNSQNDRAVISVTDAAGDTQTLDNVFDWSDQWTLRVGTVYRVVKDRVPIRLGFIYDSKTTSFQYPSGFSTPPKATYSATVGLGYDHGPWEINVAYARRFAKVTIDEPPPPGPTTSLSQAQLLGECPACGYAGDYRFRINGFYLDFSYDWEVKPR